VSAEMARQGAEPPTATTPDRAPPTRRLLLSVVPALVVGVASSLILIGLSRLADVLQDILWTEIPSRIGVDGTGPLWTVGILTFTGLAVGLVVTYAPGHAGPDPATVGLFEPPLPPLVVPGLAVALVLMLAGGVSLGPENPILGINIALAVAIGLRLLPRVPAAAWVGLALAGTLGALFGTPVAAALLLTEAMSQAPNEGGSPMWDRLFGPLAAAGAGALTTNYLGGESFVLTVAPYGQPVPVDLVTGSLIAAAVAVLGLLAIVAFKWSHGMFQRLGPPLVTLVVGGVILGLLGVIGGPITLFKGFAEMKTLTDNAADYTAGGLALIIVVKLVAVVVAGTCGFRGGRIFPSVFIGVACGLLVAALFPQVPQALAIAASVMGIIVAVTRSGWLAIFMAAVMVDSVALIPLLCIIVLPAWLVVSGRPEMIVQEAANQQSKAAAA
jgi:H+/Cl- antiporter ClcA